MGQAQALPNFFSVPHIRVREDAVAHVHVAQIYDI
jgi:hypothetical protein